MSSTSSSSSSTNRWWYVEDKDTAKKRDVVFTKPRASANNGPVVVECCKWEFKVFLNSPLQSNEKVALSGACDQLGSWSPNDSIMLAPVESKKRSYCDGELNIHPRVVIDYRDTGQSQSIFNLLLFFLLA